MTARDHADMPAGGLERADIGTVADHVQVQAVPARCQAAGRDFHAQQDAIRSAEQVGRADLGTFTADDRGGRPHHRGIDAVCRAGQFRLGGKRFIRQFLWLGRFLATGSQREGKE